jgi:hypothetical protein
MRFNSFIATLVLFIVCSALGHAQTWEPLDRKAKLAILELMESANRMDSVELELEFRSYSSHESKTMEDAELGTYKCLGGKSWSKMMGVETFSNGLCNVALHKNENKIVVSDVFAQDILNLSGQWKKYVNEEAEVHRRKQDKTTQLRIFIPASSGFEKVEITMDEAGKVLSSVVFYSYEVPKDSTDPKSPRAKPRIEVLIKNRIKISNAQDPFWSSDHVVKWVDQRPVLTDRYKTFKLIDTRYRQN